jgi:glutamate/tyrosine decarboxylase-like PLP-dependent enzyme
MVVEQTRSFEVPDAIAGLIGHGLERMGDWEATWQAFPVDGTWDIDAEAMIAAIEALTERLTDNYPFFHPDYAAQMLMPPHPVAAAAYAIAQRINPNAHASDGGPATTKLEIEVVDALKAMFGYDPKTSLGHLTSSGTIANLEALWVARELHPDKAIGYSRLAHYTHSRMCQLLRVEGTGIENDALGRIDLDALERELKTGRIGTVVATAGSTGTGAVDQVDEIVSLASRYGARVHVDAAYGGYFVLLAEGDALEPAVARAFRAIREADSIVVDPHKRGLQPYGCGSVFFKDASVGRFYKHDSPYTYFTSSGDLHLGEITLECSRPGAVAVALWATQRLLPLTPGGEFAKELETCREAALELHQRVASDERFHAPFAPELDIVVWAPKAESATEASAKSRLIFEAAARRGLHLALASLPAKFFAGRGMQVDSEYVGCLRSVLMKPEHKQWVERIYGLLDEATRSIPTGD